MKHIFERLHCICAIISSDQKVASELSKALEKIGEKTMIVSYSAIINSIGYPIIDQVLGFKKVIFLTEESTLDPDREQQCIRFIKKHSIPSLVIGRSKLMLEVKEVSDFLGLRLETELAKSNDPNAVFTSNNQEVEGSDKLTNQPYSQSITIVKGFDISHDLISMNHLVQLFPNQIRLIEYKGQQALPEGFFFYHISLKHPNWLFKQNWIKAGKKFFMDEIDGRIKKKIQSGLCVILADCSGEGSPPNISAPINAIAEEVGVDSSSIVILNQNINLPKFNKKHTNALFLYWHHYLTNCAFRFPALVTTASPPEKEREKHFICSNNRINTHRLLLMSFLKEEDLLKKGFCSLGASDMEIKTEVQEKRIKQLFPSSYNLIDKAKIQQTLPMRFQEVKGKGDMIFDLMTDHFNKSYFSIVNETEMSSGEVSRFTEKSIKPFYNFHPFIVVGNPFVLKQLREMGFRTFDGFIDESYDKVLDPDERIQLVFKEISRLCRFNKKEIQDWYMSMRPILVHNFDYAMNELPIWIREKMGKNLLNSLCNHKTKFGESS